MRPLASARLTVLRTCTLVQLSFACSWSMDLPLRAMPTALTNVSSVVPYGSREAPGPVGLVTVRVVRTELRAVVLAPATGGGGMTRGFVAVFLVPGVICLLAVVLRAVPIGFCAVEVVGCTAGT